MLQLHIGTDWVANRDEVLKALAQDIRAELGNRIWMVPELISHDAERRLCQAAGATTSRFAEVLSFSRLTKRVAEYAGIIPEECLDNGGRVVAMAAVAKQLRGSLKAYASVETKPEFLTDLVDAVDEFKRCCITPADLRSAASETEGGFAQKLEELALLYETYDAITSLGKRDPRDQMTWLLEQLENCRFGEEHIFYIDGFPDFTRQHMAILEHLICVSPKVVVSLNCDVPGSEHMAFQKAGDTAKSLINIARRHGIDVEIVKVAPYETPVSSVHEKLYQGTISESANTHIVAVRADSPYKEAEFAADRISELIYSGARFRDIGIVCSNLANYKIPMSSVFPRCNISYYVSGKECVADHPIMQTILYALEAALGGFEQRDVIRYLRSAASPVSLSDCDMLENYVLLWNISGKAWCEKWQNHPSGLGAEFTDKTAAALSELEKLRQKVIDPLMRVQAGLKNADKLSQQVGSLYAFLEDISFDQKLKALSKSYDSVGDNRNAQIIDQLWSILVAALEQMHDVLGETSWECNGFLRLLRLLLSQYDVGTIPPVLDAVTVGQVSAMRCNEVKHLIVLGMSEGDMPGYSGSAGVLSDWERNTLRQMGVPLTGGSMEGLQAELSEIYGVFCGARQSVAVSVSSATGSFVYRRLAALAGGEVSLDSSRVYVTGDKLETAALLAKMQDADTAKDLGLSEEYNSLTERIDYSFGTVTKENIVGLYGNSLNLSASQVDKCAECRLRYFLQYGLRVRERKPAEVDPAEYGTYVHAVLEETAREVMERGGFHQCSLEETLAIAHKHSEEYINSHFAQIDSQRNSYLLDRNMQELEMVVRELWEELRISEFEPTDFELYFGDDGKMPPIAISGKDIEARLRGFVDRVDIWKTGEQKYFRVVDYKTGKKDFDYCDIYNGIGLQMLLYLFALAKGGTEIFGESAYPAGVQYFPARAPLVSADGALSDAETDAVRIREWKRRGLILLDEAVMQAMQPEGSPKRLDFTVKKDGSVSGAVATRDEFGVLEKYVMMLLKEIVDDITSGNIAANPYTRGNSHNACAYCPYGQVCHWEYVEGRRDYAAMKPEEFWERIRRKVNVNG